MNSKPNVLYLCEGESEVGYLKSLLDKKLLFIIPNKKKFIKKMDVSKITKYIHAYNPKEVILCYDYIENNIQNIFKNDIKPFCEKNEIKLSFPINDPHFDHVVAHHFKEYKGKSAKEFLLKKIKKHKKITYDEIIKKGGNISTAKEKCPKSIMKHIRGDKNETRNRGSSS